MTQTQNSTKTASCGCTFQGRIYSTVACTVLGDKTADWHAQDHLTGRQILAHAMKAQKGAK
jgi:predicted NBD/HSP70 family sugar kinase